MAATIAVALRRFYDDNCEGTNTSIAAIEMHFVVVNCDGLVARAGQTALLAVTSWK
jgi:hypothetical protein